MSLTVFLESAKNIPNVETFGKSDPYACVEFQGTRKKTEVIKGELNPVWNANLEFDLQGAPLSSGDEVKIEIKDWEMVGRNRLLATLTVSLKNLLGGQNKQTLSQEMLDGNGRKTGCTIKGQLIYQVPSSKKSGGSMSQVYADEGDEEGSRRGSKAESDIAGDVAKTSGTDKDKAAESSKDKPAEPKSENAQESTEPPAEDPEDEDDEEEEDDEDEGVDVTDATGKKRRKRRKKKRKMKRKMRAKLSNKPQDFQVRIKILEARQLPGANISPVARVTCYGQTKQTRVQKSTNSPFWNQVFFFNFFASPAELFDELINFQVYNARKLRSDSFIGGFKCDIGMVYDEPQHSLLNKWLLLSDPEDNMSGAKGYLKIMATVLGPGDDAPSFKPATQEDDEDIESNLLQPAGVMLRPATFKLRIYRGEDIPRMDSAALEGMKKAFGMGEQKELVDPYFVFSFAGQEVKSKVLYNCDHPEWSQELRLGLRFPSMCERIKLQVWDWDRVTNHDAICSGYLKTTEIAAPGDHGFLPTFGPCYVNLYGSTREYSDLPNEYEDLNLGKGEGVAYRGRVLVELQTVLGEMPEIASDDINNDDLLRVQKFQRRRKYKLHAAFLNATMISEVDAPIEFEVSIGNYGNKLDENVPPCSSTTQPTNALFDGCYYYFLPWGETKPCIVVDSHWEDISFRLEALNMILAIIDRLEANMERVRVGLKANLSTPELAQLLIALLDQLVMDCSKSLPDPVDGQHVQNELDRQLRLYRDAELDSIVSEATKLRENATDVSEALQEIENYQQQLKGLAVEPQNSMPDVNIWMISGTKRIAYFRCPAYMVLYSPNPDYRGKYCSRVETIELKYPGNKADKDGKWEIPGLVRMKIWLGLEQHEDKWHSSQHEGDLSVFAETYENQVSIMGNWTNKGPTMTRGKWTDATGKVKLDKADFVPPPGWRWGGDWYVSPELSMLFDKDAGHTKFMEDVFENESRIPGGRWDAASVPFTDVKGDATLSKDETVLPEGWAWEDDWQVDLNRAVDEEGWEYTVEATLGGYGPVQKNYHMCRRRRWLRMRNLVKSSRMQQEEEALAQEAREGWEYAPMFSMKFHAKERKMDMVRRRRYHRKMVCEDPTAPCFFQIQSKEKFKKGLDYPDNGGPLHDHKGHVRRGRDPKDSDQKKQTKMEDHQKSGFHLPLIKSDEEEERYKAALTAPRMFLTFTKPHHYQMRAYIYQARDLLAGDSNGLSDPFCRVCFMNQSLTTEKLEKTLCPTWDQTLIFEQVSIHGDPKGISEKPPIIVLEIFDHDTFGKAEFLGRTVAHPMVKLDPGDARTPVLQWTEIKKGNQYGGELLCAFELFLLSEDALLFKSANELLNDDALLFKSAYQLMNGKDLPFQPPKRGSLFLVPNGIRPVMQRTAIEVLSWGVRNMRKFQLSSVSSPNVEFEIGGHMVTSKVIKDTAKNPNFNDPHLFFDIMLPREELYMPPVNIRVRDNRAFGRKPMVGTNVLKSLEVFRCDPVTHPPEEDEGLELMPGNGGAVKSGDVAIDMPVEKSPMASKLKGIDNKLMDVFKPAAEKQEDVDLLDMDIDWWSKYYASIGELKKCRKYLEKGYDKIIVYDQELEKVEKNAEFTDFCSTFPLFRGKNIDDEESDVVGEFKGSFKVYPLPPDPNEPLPARIFSNLPSSAPEPCIVRLYIIKAIDLQPNDPSGLADPYLYIRIGKTKDNTRDDYIPNTLDPVFGKMFEVKATLPIEKDLTIQIKDYDLIGTDDVIGETTIDLENRLLTKFRATCGLPLTYCTSGPNEWRDSQKPKEILEWFCKQNHLSPPSYYDNKTAKVGGRMYSLSEFEQKPVEHQNLGEPDERLALHILHMLPHAVNVPLIPEHVETRPLYNPLQPGIEQGKLQMWVDVFPKSLGPPGPPFDISPRKPKKYVLRCIIWNTKDVILEEESITGEKMSDIYVKGWLAGIDEKQKTDVHYRSLDGEGNFNWRFVFPFEYLPAETSMVVKKKEHFWSLDETELHMLPVLMIQIWDNDKFSADDFLGTLELNLNHMPCPAKKSSNCTLDQLPDIGGGKNVKMISLFEQKRARGFWPCYSDESGTKELTGKLELEVQMYTEEEAENMPAATGREEPNMYPFLEPPKRPETSFLWFTSPWKTFKHIIWRNYKWYFVGLLVIILLVLLVVLFVYSVPSAVVNKVFGVGT